MQRTKKYKGTQKKRCTPSINFQALSPTNRIAAATVSPSAQCNVCAMTAEPHQNKCKCQEVDSWSSTQRRCSLTLSLYIQATQIQGSLCLAVCGDPSSAPAARELMDDDAEVVHEISHGPHVNWVVAKINEYSALRKVNTGGLGCRSWCLIRARWDEYS